MPRSLGAGIAADIVQPVGERCQLIKFDFADNANLATPIYLATGFQDISWNAITWQAVGGTMDLDALGESADDPQQGHRLKLSGVNQAILALIMGSRFRGRYATIYHVALSQTGGTVLTDPVLLFSGPMNGGFQIGESRGDFGGGTVDITGRLTSRLGELVKVRGVRTNVQSHQTAIPAATGDTFFQNIGNLLNRKVFWGVKTPVSIHNPPSYSPHPSGYPGQGGSGGTQGGGALVGGGGSPYPTTPAPTPGGGRTNPGSPGPGTGPGNTGSPWQIGGAG